MIYLHKLLPLLFMPVSITIGLLILCLWAKKKLFLWSALTVLFVSSSSLVGNWLLRYVERWAERIPAGSAPKADAIVVLSGGRIIAPGIAVISEWADPDRFFGGVELFKSGKAPLLVFTGGGAPWEPKARLEGNILMDYAHSMGVPMENMTTTGLVVNTNEEARAVAIILNSRNPVTKRILLVTSAFHMARAKLLFEQQGLKVIPFPVDFQVSAGKTFTVIDFLPSESGLSKTSLALREIYGLIFYKIRKLFSR